MADPETNKAEIDALTIRLTALEEIIKELDLKAVKDMSDAYKNDTAS